MTDQANSDIDGEESVIQEFLAPLAAGCPGAFGLRDDCAALTPTPGCDLVLKTDPIAAGVHFFADDAPADIAWKALAVNVSDLAAKGAAPRAYLMALSFPERPPRAWLAAFAQGLAEAQRAFGLTLVGGDTDRRPGPLTISITVIGEVPAGRMVRRSTARVGDCLVVTGTIGMAWAGLQLRRGSPRAAVWPAQIDRARLIGRYLRPAPPVALAPAILTFMHAAMDVSDGLVKDAGRMARASGVRFVIDSAHVPLSLDLLPIVAADPDALVELLTGGDDYQVLGAMDPDIAKFDAFAIAGSAVGTAITRIGRVEAGTAGVDVLDAHGQPVTFTRTGYDHF